MWTDGQVESLRQSIREARDAFGDLIPRTGLNMGIAVTSTVDTYNAVLAMMALIDEDKPKPQYRLRVELDDVRYPDTWDFLAQSEEEFDEVQARRPDGTMMSWEEYQDTWGDPNNYDVFYVVLEKQCPVCREREEADSISGVIVYSPESDLWRGVYSIESAKLDKDLRNVYEDYFKVIVEGKDDND